MNPWMNERTPQRPLAYGHVIDRFPMLEPEPWLEAYPAQRNAIRVWFDNGLLLELNADLTPYSLRAAANGKWKGDIPAVESVWQQMWPPARSASPARAVVSASPVDQAGLGYALRLLHADGTDLRVPLSNQVNHAAVLRFARDSEQTIVAGFTSEAPRGRMIAFHAREAGSEREPRFTQDIELYETPPGAWNHQAFRPVCQIKPMLAEDLDGTPGDELLVGVLHDEGPMQLVVFTTGWRRVFEYWHYGWLKYATAVDLDGDGLKELICSGIANAIVEPPPFGPRNEVYHYAILVLDPRTPSEPPGHWSMNRWMNVATPRAPLAYGHVTQRYYGTSPGQWFCYRHVEAYQAQQNAIRVQLENGLLLELNPDLSPYSLRAAVNATWDGEIPAVEAVWHRMWPPGDAPP
jgi:hypothetical protein